MPYMSFMLGAWVFGLLSLAALSGGFYLIYAWYVGALVGTVYLVGGVALTLLSLVGRPVFLLLFRRQPDKPRMERGGEVVRLAGVDGAQLHVEQYGPADAPPLASPAVVARGMLAMMRWDASDVLGAIPVPALVVTGNRAHLPVLEAGETIARAIPGAHLVERAPAGYMGLIDQHLVFLAALDAATAACTAVPARKRYV